MRAKRTFNVIHVNLPRCGWSVHYCHRALVSVHIAAIGKGILSEHIAYFSIIVLLRHALRYQCEV